jgi:heme/copper-type cytochrome/quinol oxidase subunit 2
VLTTLGAAAFLAALGLARPLAQDQAPERRDLTITAKDYRFSPNRIEVSRDDLVRLTVKSEDVAYGFTIDDYRVSKRVPAGGSVVLELRADREGTFPFYSNMTSDARHGQMRGELVVRRR